MNGILFKPELIKAIVRGRKTQTRRVIKPQPTKKCVTKLDGFYAFDKDGKSVDVDVEFRKPRYQVGEVVYIKEAWATEFKYNHLKPSEIPHNAPIWYESNGVGEWSIKLKIGKLRSPLFMPAWAARYFIKITGVKVKRLQSISFSACRAEGSYMATDKDDEGGFVNLWDSINKSPYDWQSNPWVWCYEFKKGDSPR